jgi:type I restriction enzyme R subunit
MTPEQKARQQIDALLSISIEPEDLELSPFNQRGGLGKAHQLFGEQLPQLLAELNEVLAA